MNSQPARQIIKNMVRRIAPKLASEWQEARHRKHIHRFEQKIGLPKLTQEFISEHGSHVLSGPFAGMNYVSQAAGSALMPKLLGSYEEELHSIIRQIIATNYTIIIDIGCAEGYYANGLALCLPSAHVYAFDIDLKAQALCREMAKLNGTQKRVSVGGKCQPDDLNNLMTGQSLVICDCEGYEADLLRPDIAPALEKSDILVELHDHLCSGIASVILERFRGTHNVTTITATRREAENYPQLRLMDAEKRALVVSEFRCEGQQWAFFQAHSVNGLEA